MKLISEGGVVSSEERKGNRVCLQNTKQNKTKQHQVGISALDQCRDCEASPIQLLCLFRSVHFSSILVVIIYNRNCEK